MEDKLKFYLKIVIRKTNWGKKLIIIDKKYKFNYSFTKKDETNVYRCTEYKTMKNWNSLVILLGDKDIIKYVDNHNHLENETAASISLQNIK